MKAFKSLEAYNQFIDGYVTERGCMDIGNVKLITGKVSVK